MNTASEQKRDQLNTFIKQVLASEPAVKAVIGIGSIATGHMRPGSDIDAIIFLDPFDYYIVPAEAIWWPADDTFHSIFTDNAEIQEEGIQLDFLRLDWQQWSDSNFTWPEERCAELSAGWMAYDPTGRVTTTIAQRTLYPDELRLARLDEAIVWLDQHLSGDKPQTVWDTLGPAVAHDRLHAAYGYLAQALFAYNRRWRPWRNREMTSLLELPWLPAAFADRVITAANAPDLGYDGYASRAEILRALFHELLDQVVANGDYSYAPVDQAFIRSSEEPGRAWNMAEWNKFRRARLLSRQGTNGAA
jgi:hypothetical protein